MATRRAGDKPGARPTIDDVKDVDLDKVVFSLHAAMVRANKLIMDRNGRAKPNAILLKFYPCGDGCFGCPHPRWQMWKLYKPRGRALKPGDPYMVPVELAHPLKSPHVTRDPQLVALVEVVQQLRFHHERVIAQIKKRRAIHLEALRFGRSALDYISEVMEHSK